MLRVGYFPEEKLDKESAFRLLTGFVFSRSGSLKRPIVEGQNHRYIFATRQNCLMYFVIDRCCTVFGSMLIDVIYGEYAPEVEKKISRGATTFTSNELKNFTMLEHPHIHISLSLMDYNFDADSINVFKDVADKNNLCIDIYDGLYPDGHKAKACSLEFDVGGIDTQKEFEDGLEAMFKKSKQYLFEIASRLNLIKDEVQEMNRKYWQSL